MGLGKLLYHASIITRALCYRVITKLTPKDNSIWIFGAWKGNSYSDNTRYLYEYVIENYKEIKAYWITKNKTVYDYLNNLNRPVLFYPSKEAKKKLSHAKYLFQTEGYKDTGDFPVGGSKVIQLWHGISCKAFNWFDHYTLMQKIMIYLENGDRRKYLWVSTSDFYTRFFNDVFEIPKKRFIPCGYPRCDRQVIATESKIINKYRMKGYKYIGLYLPTHRNWGKNLDNDYVIKGLEELDKKIDKKGICVLFKPHPNEVPLFKNTKYNYKNIILLDGDAVDEADIYQYLYKCDYLISDYSSVIYDFLVVDKPIILFPYDIEDYKNNDSGLIDEYFSIPVGSMVYTWNDLAEKLISSIINDEEHEMRERAFMYFNEYNTESNCDVLINYLIGYSNKSKRVIRKEI